MQRSRDPGRARCCRERRQDIGRQQRSTIEHRDRLHQRQHQRAFEAEHVLLRHAADDACDGADTAVELARRGGRPGRARRERDGAASSTAARERRCCPRCRSAPRSSSHAGMPRKLVIAAGRRPPLRRQGEIGQVALPGAAQGLGIADDQRPRAGGDAPRRCRRWRPKAAARAGGGRASAARQVIRKPTRDAQRLHTADASARRMRERQRCFVDLAPGPGLARSGDGRPIEPTARRREQRRVGEVALEHHDAAASRSVGRGRCPS